MSEKVKVFNLSSENIILEEAEIANSFFKRFKGLLGRRKLEPGKGIIIRPCRSIHTMGMLFTIDLAFVTKMNCICYIIEKLKPFRVSPAIEKACYVIEAPAGTFAKTKTAVGDRVKLEAFKP